MANLYPQNTQYNSGAPASTGFKMPKFPTPVSSPAPAPAPAPAVSPVAALTPVPNLAPADLSQPIATQDPSQMFPSLAGMQIPDMSTLLAQAQEKTNAALKKMADTQAKKGAWSGLSSPSIPPSWDSVSAGFKSGRKIDQMVAAPPIPGESEALAQYQQEHPDSPLSFSPPQKFAGWSTPSDKAQIIKTQSGGFYVNDPENPQTIAHENRGGSAAENQQILNGLSSHFFQIDHRTPLFAGGVDALGQKQIIPIKEHKTKTAVQSVPYTLWFAFKDNPELAKKYGMDPVSLQQMRIALDDWKSFSPTGIPTPDENGKVPLDVAVKTWKAWHEPPKVGLWDVVKGIPAAAGKVASAIGAKTEQLMEGVPIVGPAALGALKGMMSEWAGGYPEKYVPGFFETKSQVNEEGYSVLGKNAQGQDILYKAPFAGLQKFNDTAENVGKAVGGILGGLLFYTTGGKLAGSAAKALGFGKAAAGVSEATGAAKAVAKATETPGLLARAFSRFGVRGPEAVANTEKLAEEFVKAGEGIAPAAKAAESMPFLKAIQSSAEEIPLVGDLFKAAVKKAQQKAMYSNMGTMVIANLLHQQDDRSLNATVSRAAFDMVYGAFLGNDNHNLFKLYKDPISGKVKLPGYLSVFGKSLAISVAQQAYASPDKHDFGADLENALLMTGLHGLGHKGAVKTEKQFKIQAEELTQAQKDLHTNLDQQLGWRSSGILSQVLPETFKQPGEFNRRFDPTKHWANVPKADADIVRYRERGNAAIDRLASTDFLKDENGRTIMANGKPVSAWTDADVTLAKQKFNAAVRVLEHNGATPDKQAMMEISDLKSYADLWQKQLGKSDPGVNPSVLDAVTKDGDYLFSPSTSDGKVVSQRTPVNPEMPIGKTQGTGMLADRQAAAAEDHAAVLQALSGQTGSSISSKAVIELVPNQGIKETTRRMSRTSEEAARMDMASDPSMVLRVSVYEKQPDGTLVRRSFGYIPSDYRLHDAPYALNKVPGIENGVSVGGKDVYNLDKDSLGNWMNKNKVGAVYADVGGIGRDPKQPYLKVEVTKDNLDHSIQAFAGSHPNENPQYQSVPEIMTRVQTAKTAEEAKTALETVAQKMPVEPAHELLDHAFSNGSPIPFSEDLKAPLAMVREYLLQGNPKELVNALKKTFGVDIDEKTANAWIQNRENVRVSDILNLFTKGTSQASLTPDGLTIKGSVESFFQSPEFVSSPFAGWFDQATILGSTGKKAGQERGTYRASGASEQTAAQETPISREGVPDFLDWEKPSTKPSQTLQTPPKPSTKPSTEAMLPETAIGQNAGQPKEAGTFKTELTATEERKPAEQKTFKRMPKAQKMIVESEPAPDAKPVDSPSIVQTPPKESIASVERSIGAPVEVSSIEALKNLETSEPRVVDGVDVDSFEMPTHESGRLDGDIYRASNLIFSKAQEGLETNSDAFKALEKGKKTFSRDFLRTAANDAVARSNGDTNKAFDEILNRVEKHAEAVAKEAGVKSPPLFPDENSKTAFKGLLRKITGEKDRLLLDFKDGEILGSAGRSDGKELPSYTDDLTAAYMKDHPEVGDVGIYHVRGDQANVDPQEMQSELRKKGYVLLGNPSGKSNTGMAVKFSQALADKAPAVEGTKMSKEDRFLQAWVSEVLGLKGATADNYGALYKRWKNLDNHDPRLDLRDENGHPVAQKHFFADEKLSDIGLIDEGLIKSPEDRAAISGVLGKPLGDGAGLMPEEGFKELAKQMNMVGDRGSIKYSLVHPTEAGTGLIKSVIYPMPKGYQDYLERKYGIKFDKYDVMHSTENMKLGKNELLQPESADQKGRVSSFAAPASSAQVKMTNPHKSWGAKFSTSVYARLGAGAGLNEEFLNRYKPAADQFISLANELVSGDKTNAGIRATLSKFEDLGIQIDQADYAVMDKMLRQNASGRDIWHKIDESMGKKFRSAVLSGKMSFEGTHLAIMPDMGAKGGISISSIKDTPESRNQWGGFVDVANLLQGGSSKKGLESKLQSWEATFGRGTATTEDLKKLSSKQGTLWDVLGVLEEAKRKGTLNTEGERFLQQNYRRIFLQPNEVMLHDHDVARMKGSKTAITSRFPVTRLTANARAEVRRGSDYGMLIPEGTMVASNHDVSIRKEGDYDDHYSVFPEGGDKGIPMGFGDAIEAERAKEGEIVLSGLDSYKSGPLSEDTALRMTHAGNQGKAAIGVSSSIARALTAMEDSGMEFAGKKLKMTPEKKRFLSQVQQEAADAVNKKNLSERLSNSGFKSVDALLVDKLFDLNGDPTDKRNKEIRSALSQFQTVFDLANETKPLDRISAIKDEIKFGDPDTQKIALAIQKTNALRDRILANGGKVPPTMDLVSLFKGIEGLPKVSIEGSQLSDKYAGDKLKAFAEEKYGKDALSIKGGGPEDRILRKVSDISKTVRARNRAFAEGGISSKSEAERRAFNAETTNLLKAKEQEALDYYGKVKSEEGLSADQTRRITFALITLPEMNRNFSKPVSDKRPYGNKDVRRFNQLFDDDELARAYYGFRDGFSPSATPTGETYSVPVVSGPTTAVPVFHQLVSAIKAKQSPIAQFKNLGKTEDQNK